MKFYRLRVFRRMIISVLAVVLAFYLAGLLSNAYSRRALSGEIIRSLEARTQYFAAQLDLQIQSLLSAQLDMGNDSQTLNHYVLGERLSAYQKTRTIRDISEKLNSIKRLHPVVLDLAVYFPATGERISATAPIYRQQDALDMPQPDTSLISIAGASLWLTTRYPYGSGAGGSTPSFYVQSEITPALLSAQLDQMMPEEDGMLLLSLPDGQLWSGEIEGAPEALTDLRAALAASPDASALSHTGKGFAAYHLVPSLDMGVVYCLPQSAVNLPLVSFSALNIILTALMVVLLLIYSGYMRRAFMRPIETLLQRMRVVPGAQGSEQSFPRDEFSAIYQQYEEMLQRNDRLIHENYQASYRTRMAELRQLQYQIRPHFLYNSIFLIYRMAQSAHNDDISEYASHLGSYYQYITRFADHEVSLDQEVGHIHHYVDIQNIRFGDRIRVTIDDIPPEARDMQISALLLQPLVENAYEHALADKLRDGRLRILMRFEAGCLVFTVEDNGDGMADEALAQLRAEMDRADILEEARGLANTNLRLIMRYGEGSRLHVHNLEQGGFHVSVRIPKE